MKHAIALTALLLLPLQLPAAEKAKTVPEYFGVQGKIKSVTEWRHAIGEDGKAPGKLLASGHLKWTAYPDGSLKVMEFYDQERKPVHRIEYSRDGKDAWTYKSFDPKGTIVDRGKRKQKVKGDTVILKNTNQEGRLMDTLRANDKTCKMTMTPTDDIRIEVTWTKNDEGEISGLEVKGPQDARAVMKIENQDSRTGNV